MRSADSEIMQLLKIAWGMKAVTSEHSQQVKSTHLICGFLHNHKTQQQIYADFELVQSVFIIMKDDVFNAVMIRIIMVPRKLV